VTLKLAVSWSLSPVPYGANFYEDDDGGGGGGVSGHGRDAAESGRQQHRVRGRQQRSTPTTVQPHVQSRPGRITVVRLGAVGAMSYGISALRPLSP